MVAHYNICPPSIHIQKSVGLINQAPTNNSNPFNNYKCGFDKSSPYMRMLEFFELFD